MYKSMFIILVACIIIVMVFRAIGFSGALGLLDLYHIKQSYTICLDPWLNCLYMLMNKPASS